MTKQYNTPMLQVVGINKKDIIVTSPKFTDQVAGTKGGDASGFGFAPGQRGLDDWYEGY